MSGLIALLDDVAGLAKLAAASIDDVAGQAAKAGTKAAGAVIDDAAVTPKYMQGFSPARELPMVWRIARASLVNKLVFLLPATLAVADLPRVDLSPEQVEELRHGRPLAPWFDAAAGELALMAPGGELFALGKVGRGGKLWPVRVFK